MVKALSPAIWARGIHKSYSEANQELQVLKGIDLMIEQGEIVAVMGPSGAGKSTLLHILGLMDSATSGELDLLGLETQTLGEKQKDEIRNKKIAFLFQFHHLLPELTLLENASLPLRIQGLAEKESRKRAEDLLASVGLKDRLHHIPSRVSGGEQQRTALARAMVTRPAILICDEPTGNLDLERGKDVRDLIWRVARAENSTVVIATHNPDIAKSADRVARIAGGTILMENNV